MLQKITANRRETKGSAKDILKMANDLIKDGYPIEKDSRHSNCESHKGKIMGTIIVVAHQYRFRFWIDEVHGKGSLKIQPKF